MCDNNAMTFLVNVLSEIVLRNIRDESICGAIRIPGLNIGDLECVASYPKSFVVLVNDRYKTQMQQILKSMCILCVASCYIIGILNLPGATTTAWLFLFLNGSPLELKQPFFSLEVLVGIRELSA